MPYNRICISSGHGKHVSGASGVLGDEVEQARRVVERVADELRIRGVWVDVFHDDTSHDQSTNLNTIVNHHNSVTRDIDVSVHFNAYNGEANGTECCFLTQRDLAEEIADAIASCGFVNRGQKERTDLFFLNSTEMPAVLVETAFCDSAKDADIYHSPGTFEDICEAIADVLGGVEVDQPPPDRPERPERPERPDRPERPEPEPARVDIETTGNVIVTINGIPVRAAG
jgi:N-acetylmuramoyl-L-alanine amidase